MKTMLRCCFAIALAVSAGAATAEFHTYQIEQIYSNASGTVQYVVMHESQGMAAEQFWNGNIAHQHIVRLGEDLRVPEQPPCRDGNASLQPLPLRMLCGTELDRQYARAHRHAGIRQPRADHARFHGAEQFPVAVRRHAQLRRRRPDHLRRAAHRWHACDESCRRHRASGRHQLRGSNGRGHGHRRGPELRGLVVGGSRRVGLGHQLRAPGRRDLRDLVHLRRHRQGVVAHHDREQEPRRASTAAP